MKKKRILIIFLAFVLVGSLVFFQNIWRQKVAEALFQRGEHYFSRDNYNTEKALKFYKLANIADESYPVLHYQSGRIYFLRGDFIQAMAEFEKELKFNPDFGRTYYMMGLTMGYAEKFNESIEYFQKFIQWKPETWAGYNDLAWVYLLKRDYQSAEKTVLEGLKNDSENSWLLSNLGTARMNLGKLEEAKSSLILAEKYSQALTPSDWEKTYPGNDPKIAEAGLGEMKAAIYLNLATVTKRQNLKKEAEMYYQKYLELLPENDKRKIPMDNFMLMK